MSPLSPDFWDDAVRQYPAEEYSLSEVASELGLNSNVVRNAFARRNVSLGQQKVSTVREQVQDMLPLDAVEYLLSVLEQTSWIALDDPHPTDKISVTRARRRVLRALYDADGQTVSKDALLTVTSAHYMTAEEAPDLKLVDVYICHLRKAIKDEPWTIRTVWGVGYALDRNEVTAAPESV